MQSLTLMKSLTLAVALGVASHAWAAPVQFDLPRQPLATSLRQLAEAAHLTLAVDHSIVPDQLAPAVRGNLEPASALAQLLQGTGLTYSQQGSTLVISRVQAGAMELGATLVNASALPVTTEGTGSYTTGGLTIGKGEHSLRETPQSVTVLTRKFMDDQNLNTIEEVMKKTPGITVYDSPMGGKYFYSRGFQMLGQYQYDGVPLDMGNNYVQADSFSSDMALYDRVEVQRGAAGMMKGSGGTVGAVNFVRKRGTATPHTEITLSAGSWDNYRGQVDTGGPLNASGTVRGRAVLAQQDRQYFYDHAKRQDQVFYGALDFDLTPATTLGLGVAYEDVDANPCWHGLPRYSDGSDLKLSRSTCLGASWNDWQSHRTTVFTDLKHQFNDDWALKVAGVYSKNTQDMKYGFSEGTITAGTTPAMSMYSGLFDYDQVDYGFDAYVDGHFDAFGQQHELTVGANASRSKKDDSYLLIRLPDKQNPFAPNAHIPEPPDSYYYANSYNGGPVESTTKQYGAYSTLRLKLADPLTLVLGSRVSWYKSERDSYTVAWDYPEHSKSTETGEVTPFAGVLYDLNDNLTAYASYSDIFTPQGQYRSEGGSSLKPMVGASYELGIKGEWLGGRLNTAFNLFRTIQKDQAQTDYNSTCASPDGYCYVNAGKVRAQGFEAEVSGEVIDRLQMLAGYTYTQTKTLENIDSTSEGAVFNSYVPRHVLRVWGDYALDGALDRFSVGAGVEAQSDNYRLNNTGTIKNSQSGYAVWNGRIGYRIDDTWSVAVNGNNLFDRKYYQSIGREGFGNYYGEPRNFMLTVKADL
ncbi:TonB-dependent siderophore receptor [Pseudomonas sp. MYb118]|uniref:TonB-dependent siderophore receptor n=1 Tax=Pseudomonas sp. MYb118 TaxID=1848720 RepID=UPI0034CD6994